MSEIGLVIPDQLAGFRPTEMIDFAALADDVGYSSVWKGESSENNTFMVLTGIATATESVRLGTGIASVYTRSPTLMAMSINTLNNLSDGRAILGIGVSSKPVVEEWHGLSFERPLRRLRESIEIVRELFESDTVDYDGEIFDVGPYSSNYLVEENLPPIYNAALGSTNRKLTGEFADGWIPLFAPRSDIAEYASTMQEHAENVGNDEVTIAPWIPTAVDDDPAAAESRIRHMLAQEFAMGYNRIFRDYGYGENADEVHDTWRDGDREAAQAAISDEILDEFTIYGTPENCQEQLTEYYDAGVTEPILWPSFTATRDDVENLIRVFGPDA